MDKKSGRLMQADMGQNKRRRYGMKRWTARNKQGQAYIVHSNLSQHEEALNRFAEYEDLEEQHRLLTLSICKKCRLIQVETIERSGKYTVDSLIQSPGFHAKCVRCGGELEQ